MADSAQWYTPPQFRLLDEDAAEIFTSSISWSFREISDNAKVGLSWRLGDGAWSEAEVIKATSTAYEARIKMPFDPAMAYFEMNYTGPVTTTVARSSRSEVVAVEQAHTHEQSARLQYMIHTTEHGKHKSGTIETVDLGKLFGYFVGVVKKPPQSEIYLIDLQSRAMASREIAGVRAVALGSRVMMKSQAARLWQSLETG